MQQVTPTVWTSKRKWRGNLVPALFWLPPAAVGVYLVASQGQFLGLGLWFLVGSTLLGWLAVNLFGFAGNSSMKDELSGILRAKHDPIEDGDFFVGFATPTFSSMLDAHEDVGYLRIESDRLIFTSEIRRIEVSKSDIVEVRFRPNVHSMLALGRWISVEAKTGGKSIRLLIESRQRPTMLGSKMAGAKMKVKLKSWLSDCAS